MKSKLLTSLLIVTVLVCLFAVSASAATVTIGTPEEFLTLMNEGYTMSDTFELTANIDLSETTGQTPIGTASKKFTGTFDGKGYTISGINITKSTDTSYPYVGLFGLCQKATIKNVTVKGKVTAPSNDSKEIYAGGLVAWTRGITINNCHSHITVVNNDKGGCAGGLLGYADFNGSNITVKITNSSNSGNVTAEQYTGGILGLTQSVEKANQILTITGCDNYGDITITAGNCVGGIVGYYRCGAATSTGSKFTVSDCANYGTIENKATASSKGGFTGGIIGAVLASGTNGKYITTIKLTNLYNVGPVKRATAASIGNIVGYLTLPVVENGTVAVTMSNWVNDSANPGYLMYSIGNAGEAVSLTMTNMVNNKSGKIFSSDIDLSQPFTYNTNNTVTVNGYIVSTSTAAEKKAFVAANPNYFIDNGSVKPLSELKLDTEIGSPEELVLLMQTTNDAETLDKDYKLLCDIDMTGYEQESIGKVGTGNRFTGSFDGQGYTISGLDISGDSFGVGLFGTVKGAVIKNLNVKGTIENTGSRTGGIIGQATGDVTVINCNVDVTINAIDGAAGGILGAHTGADAGTITITDCTVNGTIDGKHLLGGVVGFITGSEPVSIMITGCTNNADITTNVADVVGGILGHHINDCKDGTATIEISDCSNTGTLTANGGEGISVGGIVGVIGGDSANSCYLASVTLSNLSNTGTIVGVAAKSGSIAGVLRAAGGIEYKFSDIYAVGNKYIVGESGENSDENKITTFDFVRVYNPEGTRLIAINNAGSANVTQKDCYHADTMGQTSITSYYNMTAASDAWVMTYDGPRLASHMGTSVEVDYSIDSAEDLINLMNAPYAWGGGTFTLVNNIDLTGKEQSPIGTGGNFKFMADFDGKGKTISGVDITYGQGAGLFGTVQSGSIKNLTVKGEVNGTSSRAGGVVGALRAPFTIENVTSDVTVTAANGAAGGIVGIYVGYENRALTITGCTFNGTVNGTSYCGGIVGYVLGLAAQPMNLNITDCTNNGAITGAGEGIGGILGTTILSDSSVISINGCKNTGAVQGSQYNGGIFGYTKKDASFGVSTNVTYTINNCENTGSVTSTTGNGTGGITGLITAYSGSDLTVSNCINRGTVSGRAYNGGIVSYISNISKDEVNGASYTITGCKNYGKVETTTGNVAGGVLGYYNNLATGTENNTLVVEKCANYGEITAAAGAGIYVGGVIGCIGGADNKSCRVDVTLSELYNESATLSAKNNRGSLIGTLRPLADGSSYTMSDFCGRGVSDSLIGAFGTGTETFTVTRASNVSGTDIASNLNGNTLNVVDGYTTTSSAADAAKLVENEKWVMTGDGPILREYATADDLDVDYSIDSVEDYIFITNTPSSWNGDFTLEADLDLGGVVTTPIGNSDVAFTGTFNGKGHTISGLNIQGSEAGTGFFGVVSDDGNKTVIKNFTVKGTVNCEDHRFVGGFVGIVCGETELDGLVNYATVTSGYFGANAGRIGGIVGGFVNNNLVTAINDIDNDGDFGLTVKNCKNYGKIEGKLNTEYVYSDDYNEANVYVRHSQARVGGIIGSITPAYQTAENKGSNNIVIESCENHGKVIGIVAVGGIAGVAESSKATNSIKITKCSNYGDVSSVYAGGADIWFGTWTGGIVGYANISGYDMQYVDTFEVSYCYNEGEVSAPNAYLIDSRLAQPFVDEDDIVTDGEGVEDGELDDTTSSAVEYRAQVGGIVGYSYGGYEDHVITIKSCYNNGVVWANGNDVAGIVGIANSAHVYDCYNTGRVESTFIDTKSETRTYGKYVGGIIGRIAGGLNDFERNFNKGEVASTGGKGMFGVGGGYNEYPDFYADNFYFCDNVAVDKNSVKVTEAQLGDYSVFTGINESEEWIYTVYGPELEYFHKCENTEKVVTTEGACTVNEIYNEVCRCLETVYKTGVVGELDPDNHAFEESVWAQAENASTYEFKCKDCGKVMATAETPYVYVDAYTFISKFVGDDENDGVTPETAVYSIEEAVRRMAKTGGKVIICDRYYLGKDGATEINLPAYEKTITITTKLTDAGKVNTGFAVVTTGVHFNLGGPTKFENIIFNGTSDTKNNSDNGYYKIPVICAGWNDVEFGSGVAAYGAAYFIAGNCYHDDFKVTTDKNDAVKTQNLVFSKITAYDINDASGNKLQSAVTFFNRVYLGDRVRDGAVDNVAYYAVANKTVTATFNNTTVIDMYTAAVTSPEAINAQMSGINTTVNLNDSAYVRYIHTGDGNTNASGNGTAYMDKLTVNVNDNARVYGTWTLENVRDLTVNISAEEDGRTNDFGVAAKLIVTVSKGYVSTGSEKLAITYGSHSFKKGTAAPAYNALYKDNATVTVKDDCDWGKAELDVARGVYVSICSYCGAEKTTEFVAQELAQNTYMYGISATLANELLVEYLVRLDADVVPEQSYLVVEHYKAGQSEPETVAVEPHKVNAGETENVYRFYAPGVAAKEMNDRFVITFFAVMDGEIYTAKSADKSIVDYYNMAYKAYGNETRGQAPALMNTLYALLNYGAEAQRYFEYNTANLVNAVIPESEQKTEFVAEATEDHSVTNDCANDIYTVSEYAPILEDRIVMAVSFKLAGDAVSNLSFKGSYTDINGNNKTFVIGGENIIVTETSVLVYVDAVSAKDLRQTVTGALYSGDVQVSDSISFSFESYAARAAAAEKNICNAILNYCDAARELFKKPVAAE